MSSSPNGTVRRWQEEVARNPGSAAFVPLADLYRVQGRLDVARRVCTRGLERNPDNVEGHYLLGRICRDGDEPQKAYDEWDIALTLDPYHLGARRAIAFLCLERGDAEEAERHLRRALEQDPDDQRLTRALSMLRGARGQGLAHSSAYWDAAAPLLERFLEGVALESRARYLMIIEPSGRIVARHGVTGKLDLAGIASLTAGIHSAATVLARMTGQRAFSQLHQGTGDRQLFMGSMKTPAGELLMICLFGEESSIGLIRSVFKDRSAGLDEAAWPDVDSGGAGESLEDALAAGLARAVGRSNGEAG